MKKMKVFLGLLLSVVMLFTVAAPALAANKCTCGKTPVISVTGIAHVPLVNGEGKQVFAPEGADIASTVLGVVPALGTFLNDGDVNALLDSLIPAVQTLFDPIKCDANGTPVDPSVHIDRYFEDPAASYNYEVKEGIVDEFSAACGDAVGGDHVFVFTYDWRRDMFDLAADLNKYIKMVKEKTGHDKVAINGQSMGTCVVQTYLTVYGTGDLETVAQLSGAYTGVEMVGNLFKGNVEIDPDGLVDIIVQAIKGKSGDSALGQLLKYTSLFERVLEKLAPMLEDESKARIYNELLIPYFGYIPSLWALVPLADFQDALNFMFKDVQPGMELMAKLTRYMTRVQLPMESRVKGLVRNSRVNYFCVSHYNRQIAPITPTGKMNSDGVIETVHTSGFATVVDRNTYLPEDYTQAVNCHDKHISPDRVIDASTCWAPENTWFIKDMDHVGYTAGNSHFFVWLMTADKQYDVYTNPIYTQFMKYNPDYDRLAAFLYEYGDVDLNGKIDLVDARLALRHCVNREYLEEVNFQRADPNVDGIISKKEIKGIMAVAVSA